MDKLIEILSQPWRQNCKTGHFAPEHGVIGHTCGAWVESTSEVEEDWFSVCRKITRLGFKGEEGKRGANTPLAGHKVKDRGAQGLTGNMGENCLSQSPNIASKSSPSGRASKLMSCRIRSKPMSSRLLWIETTVLLMSHYKSSIQNIDCLLNYLFWSCVWLNV